MKLAIDLLFGIIFSMSLAGLGVFLFNRIFKIKFDFAAGFFGGCGISIVFLFAFGVLGLFSRALFIIFIIGVFLFSIAGWRALFGMKMPIERRYFAPLALLILVMILAGFASLSPPIKNDTLYYHLGLPKLWAMDGAIQFYPWLSFSTTALSGEVLLTPIVSLVSPEAAQFFVFIVGIMVILLLGKGYTRHFDKSAGSVILILASVSFFTVGLFDAKNDYLAAGFALASFVFYLDYLRDADLKYILISGIFAGLAASTKANSLIFAVAMMVMILIAKHRIKHVLMFALPCIMFGSPWYIKSLIHTGNPFYPFFNDFFNSPIWPELFTDFNKATGVDSEQQKIINFITSPFRLAYLPDIFRARMGPLPFVLLPILVFIRNIPAAIKRSLVVVIIFYALWYVAWPNGRYLMPAIILLCLAAAYVLDWLSRHLKPASFIVILSIMVLIILMGVQVYRDGGVRAKTALGLIDKTTFLKTVTVLNPNELGSSAMTPALPYYDIWQYINTATGTDAVVGILCSNWNRADGFYLDRRFVYLNPSNQIVVDFTSNRSSIARSISNNDFRYMLIDNNVVREFNPASEFVNAPGFEKLSRGVADFIDIVKQNGRLEYGTDRFELYRMKNL